MHKYVTRMIVFAALLGCRRQATVALTPASAALTMDDMAIVYTPDNGAGWSGYHSDGTPRDDSTARIASVGMYQAEGGDIKLGIRLTRAAYARGLHDPNFYSDFVVLMNLVRRPADAQAACADALRRWNADARFHRLCDAQHSSSH